MSQITTHVLDTSTGKPANNINLSLEKYENNSWRMISSGITNEDGRVRDLLKDNEILELGKYRIIFETEKYFSDKNIKTFYPNVSIEFYIYDNTHYHIPLLLSPFGYSTYRGS
jgi:hydroxyisourate hydrolase